MDSLSSPSGDWCRDPDLHRMNRIRALFGCSGLWLVLGLVLFIFSHGRWVVPICSWFAFVFLIRFHRTSSRSWLGIVALWAGISACHALMYYGSLPDQPVVFSVACLLLGAIWVFPFVVDRLLYRRLHGFASTLVWPALTVTINYFLGSYVPGPALSQIEYLSLVQIVSITGMGGLVFLIFWFAATVNRIWESGFEWRIARMDGSIFLGAMILVLLYGETRLAFASSVGETMQVALVNLRPNALDRLEDFETDIVMDLFAASQKAVDADSRVIAWSEANVNIPASYESDLIELGKEFAKDNEVFLFMSFRTWPNLYHHENKTVGFSPAGDVVVDYLKSKPVPVLESGMKKGDGKVAIATINDARTGHVICYDMDFPSLIQQAGRHDVDILFAPSSDWREVRFFHATPARFRAIENGCSLVRPTVQGLSIATDPYGRMVAYHDYYSNAPRLTMVGVPSHGVTTIYSSCGELFSIVCVVLMLGLIGLAYRPGSVPFDP